MYVTTEQLVELGVSSETIRDKVTSGEWQTSELGTIANGADREVLISSLPRELQIKWALNNSLPEYPERVAVLLSEATERGLNEQADEVVKLLTPLSPAERRAWVEEAIRMSKIAERYGQIKPKRRRNLATGAYEFVPEVIELCRAATCDDQLILLRHPHKALPLAPHTLDDLHRHYNKRGLVVFLPKIKKELVKENDERRAVISSAAVEWVNRHWRRFSGARFLYRALKGEASKQGWVIPSESWIYRYWESMPEVVRTYYLEGKNSYTSKHAPYVPRDYSDLHALQVLCGDHSLRDVTVTMPDGTLARPALSLWLDLRTYLIWGVHLSIRPSSHTAALAYANGVRTFGAQPPSRPEAGYFSFIYTDQGRDFRARSWDGAEILVTREELRLDSGLEMVLAKRRVGILDDLNIRHILARGYNAREKPVERVFKVISEWEQNTFEDYCGRDAKHKPDAWRSLYRRYEQAVSRGDSSSPFITFEQYRERLEEFIRLFNNTPHNRSTLGIEPVIPLEEYKRCYTTRYEISAKTLALIIMKPVRRKIGKLGVNCFRKHWFYYHEAMSEYKKKYVEVRYSEDDYSRVFVVLPDGAICEATLISPTSIINPNQQTLKAVKKIQAHEKAIIRDFQLIAQSNGRGESVEDRAARQLQTYAEQTERAGAAGEGGRQSKVYLWTSTERKRISAVPSARLVTKGDVAAVEADESMFEATPVKKFNAFDEG